MRVNFSKPNKPKPKTRAQAHRHRLGCVVPDQARPKNQAPAEGGRGDNTTSNYRRQFNSHTCGTQAGAFGAGITWGSLQQHLHLHLNRCICGPDCCTQRSPGHEMLLRNVETKRCFSIRFVGGWNQPAGGGCPRHPKHTSGRKISQVLKGLSR